MPIIQQRLPHRQEVVYVFSVAVFVVFGWSLRGFFNLLPSFLRNQTPNGILGILSYMMAFALVESLLVIGGLVLASVVLPGKWYKEGFAHKSFLIILVAAIWIIRLQGYLSDEWPAKEILIQGFGVAFLILILLLVIVHFLKPLQNLVLEVEDRLQVFLYLYVPVGILGVLIIIIRNLG